MPTPPRTGPRQAVRALRHRDFALFWCGAVVSNIGTFMQGAAIPFVIYDLTGSESLVGVAAFLGFGPIVLMGPLAGAIADRYPRRTVLLVTQSLLAGVALAQWAVWVTGNASVASLIALVAVGGLIAGISIPSFQSLVSELVPRDELLNAVVLNSAQFNVARAVGPALAGVLLAGLGAGAAFFGNAVSFVFVVAALLAIRARPAAPSLVDREGNVARFTESLRYVRGAPELVVPIVLVSLVALLGMPVVQLLPVYAAEVFEVDGSRYGLLAGAMGAGGVVAASVISGWLGEVRRSQLVGWAVVVYGGGLVGFALAGSFPLGVVLMAVAGAGQIAIVSTLNTTVQLLVADELRGRVMALYVMAFTGAFPLGALVQGTLAGAVGAPAVTVGSGLVLLGLAGTMARQGVFVRFDRRDPVDEPVADDAPVALAAR